MAGVSPISGTSIHVSRGWTETINAAHRDVYSDAIWTGAYKALSKLARRHTYVGNKRVSFFDLRAQNDEDRARILTWAQTVAVENLAGAVQRRRNSAPIRCW